MDLHVILGLGPVGRSLAARLVGAGHRVRAVSLSGHPVAGGESVRADLRRTHEACAALEGASVAYLCASPPLASWTMDLPLLQGSVMNAASAAGVRLVSAQSAYAYGRQAAPLLENAPLAANTRLCAVRAEQDRELLSAHRDGRVQAAIVRAGDIYGPGVRAAVLGERLFRSVLTRRRVKILGDPDLPHTYTFVDDFAAALAAVGERPDASGVWHAPSAETLTTREMLHLVFEAAYLNPRIASVSARRLRRLGRLSPGRRRLADLAFPFEAPFVLDHRRFAGAFELLPTPHREAIGRTVSWWRDVLRRT